MDQRIKYGEPVSDNYLKSDTNDCEVPKQESIEKLKERIAELELELQKQKAAAEKGNKPLKAMWGHDFNDDCLF